MGVRLGNSPTYPQSRQWSTWLPTVILVGNIKYVVYERQLRVLVINEMKHMTAVKEKLRHVNYVCGFYSNETWFSFITQEHIQFNFQLQRKRWWCDHYIYINYLLFVVFIWYIFMPDVLLWFYEAGMFRFIMLESAGRVCQEKTAEEWSNVKILVFFETKRSFQWCLKHLKQK